MTFSIIKIRIVQNPYPHRVMPLIELRILSEEYSSNPQPHNQTKPQP